MMISWGTQAVDAKTSLSLSTIIYFDPSSLLFVISRGIILLGTEFNGIKMESTPDENTPFN